METWLLQNGDNAQFVVFFSLLLTLLVLERAFPKRRPDGPMARRWLANAALTVLAILVLPLVPVSFVAAALWAQSSGVGLLNVATAPTEIVVVATLLLRGFISFFTHWLNHKLPWLWRLHRVHHLDTELDVTSTVRFHPIEMPLTATIGLPLIVAFGLNPWVLVIYELLDASVTLFSHSNLRLPTWLNRYLRYIIVTPDLHRVHHSSWRPETDSNFSAVFPIWDIVFRTFRTETREPQETMELGLKGFRGGETTRIGWLLVSPFVQPRQADTPAEHLT